MWGGYSFDDLAKKAQEATTQASEGFSGVSEGLSVRTIVVLTPFN